MLLFQKLVDETQMPKPQEYTDTSTNRYLHFDLKVVFSWPPMSAKVYQIRLKDPVY